MTVEGTRFGRYLLMEVLGEGGMGKVYRTHDTQTDRTVAVKVLHSHTAADRSFRERFRREARAVAGLGNPHIVPIFDYGEIDGHLFMAMQLVDGSGLDSVLVQKGLLPVGEVVAIIEQAAEALDVAHGAGLIHRDVKPSNLLVTSRGFVYLIDFGIARATGETELTSTGATIGTFAYMAPERFTAGTADSRSDVYALACVLYQCLTGQTPFPGNSAEQQIAAHLTMTPPQPSRQMPSPVPYLDAVIARGMAKDPDQRYRSAGELAAAARAAITTTAAVARPAPWTAQAEPEIPDLAEDLRRPERRATRAVFATVCMTLVAAIVLVATMCAPWGTAEQRDGIPGGWPTMVHFIPLQGRIAGGYTFPFDPVVVVVLLCAVIAIVTCVISAGRFLATDRPGLVSVSFISAVIAMGAVIGEFLLANASLPKNHFVYQPPAAIGLIAAFVAVLSSLLATMLSRASRHTAPEPGRGSPLSALRQWFGFRP
ncbi:serine/threonine-protein kinase [Nocardia sp. NPDC004722]